MSTLPGGAAPGRTGGPFAGLRRGVALLVVGCLAALLTSCATRPDPPVLLPPPDPRARGIVVIAHGVEGKADSWPVGVERQLRAATAAAGDRWDFYRVDWYEASLNRLAAPRRGFDLGRCIAAELTAPPRAYEVVHLIGHSAGAHVVQGVADALATDRGRRTGDTPVVFLTFLDPFVARSLVQLHWGARHFGEDAVFAESYVTRHDPVPFTNSLLRNAYNVDLTASLPPRPDPPSDHAHGWPIHFYTRSVGSGSIGIDTSPAALLGGDVSGPAARRCAEALRARYPAGEVVSRCSSGSP